MARLQVPTDEFISAMRAVAEIPSSAIAEAIRAAERAAKPRIRPVPASAALAVGGWYECVTPDRRAIGRTPAAAYRSWMAASAWTQYPVEAIR